MPTCNMVLKGQNKDRPGRIIQCTGEKFLLPTGIDVLGTVSGAESDRTGKQNTRSYRALTRQKT